MTNEPTVIAERYVYAAMFICLTMMTSLLWLPAQLGALAQGYGFGPADLSPLASAENAGFLLGTLFTSAKTIHELKRWVFIGCITLIVVNITLMIFAPHVPFILMRPIAGIGSGIGFGYALKVCAMSARPTRSFGILTGLMSGTMIIGFQSVAHLIVLQTTEKDIDSPESVKGVVSTVFGLYAAFAAIAALIYFTNRPPAAHTDVQETQKAHGLPNPLVLIGLLGIVVSFIGQGAIWAFLQTLGVSHGFSVGSVANAMSAFAIMGIVGSFSAAGLPRGTPRWIVIGLALLTLWGGLYALYAPRSVAWYVVGCAIGGFYWNFALPLILALLAQIDPTGMASVLGGTMSSFGAAMGPLVAGVLIKGSNYQPVGWYSLLHRSYLCEPCGGTKEAESSSDLNGHGS